MDVGIRDLKNNLSRHLKSVREGNAITVTDHGKPIARIEPIKEMSVFDQMVADGRITLPKEPKGTLPEPIKAEGSIMEFLFEQRD